MLRALFIWQSGDDSKIYRICFVIPFSFWFATSVKLIYGCFHVKSSSALAKSAISAVAFPSTLTKVDIVYLNNNDNLKKLALLTISSQLTSLPLNRKTVLEQQKILFDWFENELEESDQRRLLLTNMGTLVFQCSFIVFLGMWFATSQFLLIPYLGYLHMKNDGTNSTAFFSMVTVPWYTGTDGMRFYSGFVYTVALATFIVLSYFHDAFIIMNAYVMSRLSKLLSYRFEKLKFCRENKVATSELIRQHQKIGVSIINFHNTFQSFFFTSFVSNSLMFATLTFQLYLVSITLLQNNYSLSITILMILFIRVIKKI